MNHQTISMAYILREKPSQNIDTMKLKEMGLQVGSWLQQLKNPLISDEATVEIQNTTHRLGDLREKLLVETAGQSLAYLTDFLMGENAQEKLLPVLQGCSYMVCESQYLSADIDLARKNYHMTAQQVGETALKAQVKELILFHISDRYQAEERQQLLTEAQAVFPNSRFPKEWETSPIMR